MTTARNWVVATVASAPDRLALVFLAAAATVTVLLQLHAFNPYLAIAITGVLIVASWRLVPYARSPDRTTALGSLVAIQVVVAWIWVNAPYYEQELSVYRDPSIYALRGWWLTRHASPLIDLSQAAQGARGVTGAAITAGGFPVQGDTAYPQGASLVPGLLAVAGRLAGMRAMLAANLVIAGVALLLLYALARQFMGPVWALVPMVALALSMPMVYFARASYTEPAEMAAVFGGLLLLVAATRSGRSVLYVLAGVTAGVSTLARVDGVLIVDGALLGIGVAAAAAVDPARRRELRRGLIAFAIGATASSLVGWYDLKYNSRFYYPAVWHNMRSLFVLLAVVVVGTLAVSYLPLARLRRSLSQRRAVLSRAGVIIVLVVCAVMASRPLWWIARFNTDPLIHTTIKSRQKNAGLPIDPARSYDEHTVSWLAWYLGWPVVVLAAVGLALLVARIARGRDVSLLAFFATFGLVAALYLNQVSITPDQIWAMRRLLPVIVPGVLIAAGYLVVVLARSSRLSWLAAPLAVLIALGPAMQWRYLFMQPEFAGEFGAVNAACAAVHQGAAGSPAYRTALVGSTPGTGYWAPTLKIVCGAAVVSVGQATPANLAQIRSNWGGGPVTVVSFSASAVPWTTSTPPPPRYSGQATLWNQPLTSRPVSTITIGIAFWVGVLGADGRVTPLT